MPEVLVATKPCGCVVAIISAELPEAEHKLNHLTLRGLDVEKCMLQEGLKLDFTCPHKIQREDLNLAG